MAIRSVTQEAERLPTVDEIMAETGMPRQAAALHLLLLSGETLANDRVFVPEDQREAVLRELEEAEAALIAAMERAAAVVDPAATVEENIARTGLDRRTIELYLSLRPDASSDDRERLAEPPE